MLFIVGCVCLTVLHCEDFSKQKALIERKASDQSRHLVSRSNETKYDVHGLFGIFAAGLRIKNKTTHHSLNYHGVKTDFLINNVCAIKSATAIDTICEVGFYAGLSALLFLEAAPNARVVSFDLGDLPWSHEADRRLQRLYPPSRFPGVIFGDAALNIPKAARTLGIHCDMSFIDGSKTFQGRLQSILALRAVSHRGSYVFMDEVSTKRCVDGSIPQKDLERRCAHLNWGYWPSIKAYNVAVNRGILRIDECVSSIHHPFDGICRGIFL